MKKFILLTFDLEEFDLPQEYNIAIDKKTQMAVSTSGLLNLLAILKQHNLTATFFTTAHYAENNPSIIQKLVADGHEIASHLYYHSVYNTEHLLQSKQKLEAISQQKVSGIRIPRLKQFEYRLIKEAGYLYDSSLNPTYLPGRYNYFTKPRTLFTDEASSLLILPLSVSHKFRFPLFWLSFKNLYLPFYITLCKRILKKDDCLHLYFHPWEFTELNNFNLPWYIQRRSGQKMTNRLNDFISTMKKEASFIKVTDYLCKKSSKTLFQLRKDTEAKLPEEIKTTNKIDVELQLS